MRRRRTRCSGAFCGVPFPRRRVDGVASMATRYSRRGDGATREPDAIDATRVLTRRRIVKSKPRYDPGWRKDTLEVLRALLQKRPATRLCTLRDVGNMTLYKDYDWAKLEKCELPPPFVPRLRNDEDRTYVPRRVATQEVPEKPLAYTKGDSMRKLFRKFSHRSTVSRASTDDGPN